MVEDKGIVSLRHFGAQDGAAHGQEEQPTVGGAQDTPGAARVLLSKGNALLPRGEKG